MAVEQAPIVYSDWSEWRPGDYLAEYYAEVMPDERFAMEFLVESLREVDEVPVALDFGCGPTAHHLFPLVPKAQEIHLAEYLAANREEVERWITGALNAFSWREFALETLRLEGLLEPSTHAAAQREKLTRSRITRVLPGDAGETDPLGADMRGFYPLVTTHYCAEGATNSKSTWERYMRNICSLVAPGGMIILSACGAADFYMVGERRFPCAGVTAQDILGSLSDNGFGNIDLRVRQVPDHSEQGYSSVLFTRAEKQLAPPPGAQ